jgi:hypothetical protein
VDSPYARVRDGNLIKKPRLGNLWVTGGLSATVR